MQIAVAYPFEELLTMCLRERIWVESAERENPSQFFAPLEPCAPSA